MKLLLIKVHHLNYVPFYDTLRFMFLFAVFQCIDKNHYAFRFTIKYLDLIDRQYLDPTNGQSRNLNTP
jgi:hypothetical protein